MFICTHSRKATSLCRSFGPAWLALGHSYGLESEHDHAISAYFTAADVMRGYVVDVICQHPYEYRCMHAYDLDVICLFSTLALNTV
jgi:hypothetical protein